MATRKSKSSNYTTDDIDSPEGLAHVRLRPTTHLGEDPKSTGFREIVDNAFDEVDGGYADRVDIYIHGDNDFEVVDNGRGVPVNWDKKRKSNGIILTLGRKESGQNFRSQDGEIAGNSGTNGVGASAVNAVSKRFDVESRRDGKAYNQSFREGVPVTFTGKTFDPEANFKETGNVALKGVKAGKGLQDGTSVRWSFDDDILDGYDLNLDGVLQRAKYSAFLLPGSLLVIHDREGNIEEYEGKENIAGTVQLLQALTGSDDKETLTLSGEGEFSVNRTTKRRFAWEVSARINEEGSGNAWGFANRVYNIDGGRHVSAATTALSKAAFDKISSMRTIGKKKGDELEEKDFEASLDVVISVRGADIHMKGQEKAAVTSANLGTEIRKQVLQEVEKWLAIGKNKAQLNKWGKAALSVSREKKSVEKAKKRAKEQKVAERVGRRVLKPEKLVDCVYSGNPLSELWIVEGNSAGGTAQQARNTYYQAVMPVRGKVLNVIQYTMDKIEKNAEVMGLISAAGTGFYDNTDITKSEYGKYVIATDADSDGFHIEQLLITAFYKMMPPLLSEGYVWIAESPLWAVKDPSKKDGEKIFAYTPEELEEAKKEIFGRRKVPDEAISRFKGLGSMNKEDFMVVMEPGNRRIYQLGFAEAGRIAENVEKEAKNKELFSADFNQIMHNVMHSDTSWRKKKLNAYGIAEIEE